MQEYQELFPKKNNNVFNNEEQIICYTLMQKEKKHYRDMPDFLELLEKEIGLKRIPHFTTINKFILKAKPIWFERLIAKIVKPVETEENLLAAIDRTGFSPNQTSGYYGTVIKKTERVLAI